MKIETKPLNESDLMNIEARAKSGLSFTRDTIALIAALREARKPSLRGRKFATRCDERGVGVWRVA